MAMEESPRFVARFRRLAKEMENHLGPPEMAPGPDADDLSEAASYIEELHRELSTLKERLETAGKRVSPQLQAVLHRIADMEIWRDTYPDGPDVISPRNQHGRGELLLDAADVCAAREWKEGA